MFDCSLCPYKTENRLELNSHAFSKHYQCIICSKTFQDSQSLIDHKKKDHTKKNASHNCQDCDFSSRNQNDVQFHIVEEHQKCFMCDENFDAMDKILQHLKNIHEYQVLKCDSCPFESLRISQLLNHKNSHIKNNDQILEMPSKPDSDKNNKDPSSAVAAPAGGRPKRKRTFSKSYSETMPILEDQSSKVEKISTPRTKGNFTRPEIDFWTALCLLFLVSRNLLF